MWGWGWGVGFVVTDIGFVLYWPTVYLPIRRRHKLAEKQLGQIHAGTKILHFSK